MANGDINISAQLSQKKLNTNQTPTTAIPSALAISQVGDKVKKDSINVGATDITLSLGTIVNIGWVWFQNLLTASIPPSVVFGITQGGTPGTTRDDYVIVANYPDGSKSISAVVSTALAAATLNSTNYNILTWASVGATSYDIYRVFAGGTPSTLGKIANTASLTYNDQGAAGDGAALPAAIISQYPIGIGIVSGTYPIQAWAGEYFPARWNAAAIHVKALGPPVSLTNLQTIICEQ